MHLIRKLDSMHVKCDVITSSEDINLFASGEVLIGARKLRKLVARDIDCRLILFQIKQR